LRNKVVRGAEAISREPGEKLPKGYPDALHGLYEIGKAYNPARFATYDEEEALLGEVKAWHAEEKKKSTK
jgi:hypothetical protein